MWEQLPNYLEGCEEDALVVVDTSDSMTWYFDALALKTALSVGLYFAERNKGPYKMKVISFNSNPTFVDIKGDNFVERIRYMSSKIPTGGSTNFEGTFDLIMEAALKYELTSDQIPKRLIVISDMEFDEASYGGICDTQTLMQHIKEKWHKTLGEDFTIPKLVFWNVNAMNDQFPMTMDDAGVQFVSGCNPSIFKHLMKGGENLSAYDLMLEVLNDDRYSLVTI
jgi:hypothetical protein